MGEFVIITEQEALMKRKAYLEEQTPETMPDVKRRDKEVAVLNYYLENLEEIDQLKSAKDWNDHDVRPL